MQSSGSKSFEVGTVETLPLADASRHREIPLKIFYPVAAGSFPLILFSHGSGGSKDSYDYLGQYWARHGYVSFHPTHHGSDTAVLKNEGLRAMMGSNDDPHQWVDRVRDMAFLLDSLDRIGLQVPAIAGKIDRERIAAAGHSFGAYTAILLAGASVVMPTGETVGFRDPRFRAFLTISPQGSGLNGLVPNSWMHIEAPVMSITGSEDKGRTGQSAEWRLEAYYNMPPGNKYLIVIQGAGHFGFSDRSLEGLGDAESSKGGRFGGMFRRGEGGAMARRMARMQIDPQSVHQYTQIASLAFWDAYLKDEAAAREHLASGEIFADNEHLVSLWAK
ncbi:alpha/beta hydrolase family protein [Gloeobacter violaceus]|uniref:Glr1689 protein n=1 Tax=Gloeobacter violaceus (strain ATCC 29082 / PCC 7421) TaxID=251221 RepID=Q7NJZ2_GLOVI|nr:alpha/beta fold hydrolase [Gloeobacter violaceus]BAC89630.1 glr1689 [Gloeobacter violaceus PCC 7421]